MIRRRALVKKQDTFQHLEGIQYLSQVFYETGNQGISRVKKRSWRYMKKERI